MLLRFLLVAIAVSISSTLALPKYHVREYSCSDLAKQMIVKEIADMRPTKVIISYQNTSAVSSNPVQRFFNVVPGLQKTVENARVLRLTGCWTENENTWISLIRSLKTVRKLSLIGTNIEEFNFEWISSENLLELYLNENKLKLTGSARAIRAKHLEKFSCMYCNLSNSDLDVLKYLKSLRNLDLTGNDIDVSYALEVLPQVKVLNGESRTQIMNEKSSAKSNSFKSGPCYLIALLSVALFRDKFSCLLVFILLFSIANAQSTALKLQDINTTELKEDFFDLNNYNSNYTSITIRRSNIFYVEYSAFSRFENLHCLNLGGNKLTSFHIERNNLRVLDLSENQITSIDVTLFENSPDLQELHLDGNQLTSIEWDLSFHATIRTVYLNHNQLEAMSIISPTIVELWMKANDKRLQFSPACRLKQLEVLEATGSDIQVGDDRDLCLMSESKMTIHSNVGTTLCPARVVTPVAAAGLVQKAPQLKLMRSIGDGNIGNKEELNKTDTVKEVRRLSGCELTTLRVSLDDVVFTREEYKLLILQFFALIVTVLLMTACLIVMSWRYLRGLKNTYTPVNII